MVAALPSAQLDKLASICGLLSSDFEGERAAAALKATQLLKRHGLAWRDLFSPEPQKNTWGPMRGDHGTGPSSSMNTLTPWERQFLESVKRRPRSALSAKQAKILADIQAKMRAANG